MTLNTKSSSSVIKVSSDGHVLRVLAWPIASGKTTYLARYAASTDKLAIYIIPSYDEERKFIEVLRKFNPKKKVVILKGKWRLCIRESKKLSCKHCQYRKLIKVNPPENIYTEKLYIDSCPYYNLLEEAKSADVVVSHVYALYELYKRNNLPYNPQEAVLMIDEGEMVLRMLSLKPLKIIDLKETTFKWLNIRNTDLFKLIDLCTNPSASPKLYNNLPDPTKRAFNFMKEKFNPYNYLGNKKTVKEAFKANIPNIELELKKLSSEIDPIETERAIQRHSPFFEDDKRLLIDFVWGLFSFKEFKVVKSKWNPEVDEVWLIPDPVPLKKLFFILEHGEIFLSSGSLTKRDLEYLKMHEPNLKIDMLDPKVVNHSHVLVLVANRYNVFRLAYELSKEGYLTYVVQSSYRQADEFSRELKGADVATPKRFEELENAIRKGVKVINLVQSSPLSKNLRLRGDVAVVNSWISKHVELYDIPQELKRKCILGETYQALGRIIDCNSNPVVLIMNREIYEVLEDKFKAVNATVKEVKGTDQILAEVKEWIKKPIGLKVKDDSMKVWRVRAKLVTKKGKYKYAEVLKYLPPEYAGKDFIILPANEFKRLMEF